MRVLREPVPAELAELAVGILEAGRRAHAAVLLPAGAGAIAGGIERVEHAGRKLAGFLEDRFDRVGGCVAKAGKRRNLAEPCELV